MSESSQKGLHVIITSLILVPSKATLKKYGLSVEEWKLILDRQGGVCFVCKKVPGKNRLCIDHEHVKGWKQLPPERRKLFVRALVCWFCNHYYLSRGISVFKAENVVRCLQEYEDRLKAAGIVR